GVRPDVAFARHRGWVLVPGRTDQRRLHRRVLCRAFGADLFWSEVRSAPGDGRLSGCFYRGADMEVQVLVLTFSFFALLLLSVPIAPAIGLSTLLTIVSLGDVPASYIVAQRMSTGIGSFPLLAIPFFILSGVLMGEGGMARRLMDFAAAAMGRFHGGLAYVNTLTCMLFGAVSGSAAAAVSSLGGVMIPEMERNPYGAPLRLG